MRNAVEKVAGAVERIDDEARLVGLAGNLTPLFHQEAPPGASGAQFVPQRPLGGLVSLGDEVRRALAADLQMLDLAEIATQAPARLARSALHDSDEAGDRCHYLAIRMLSGPSAHRRAAASSPRPRPRKACSRTPPPSR